MSTSVILYKSVRDHILHYCMEKKPHEACGFLLGFNKAETIFVNKFLPVSNIAGNPDVRFEMNPQELLPIIMNAQTHDYLIQGILHSHPTSSAVPSISDLQSAWHQIPSHWIVSLQDERSYDIQAYRYIPIKYTTPEPHFAGDKLTYLSIPYTVCED